MPHQKLIRVLNYVWLLVVFPVAVAILVGRSRPKREPWDQNVPPHRMTDSSMRRETYTKALADVVHHVLIGMASASALAAAETAEEKFAGITAVTPASGGSQWQSASG